MLTMAVTAGALLLGAMAATAKGPPPGGGGGPSSTDVFELSGSVEGLYPGADLELPVKVENPARFAVRLLTLDVSVADSAPTCLASEIVVGAYAGGVEVPALGEVVVELPIMMRPSAPDACQGATFSLTYIGTAERV
jgi:hypothetical protein